MTEFSDFSEYEESYEEIPMVDYDYQMDEEPLLSDDSQMFHRDQLHEESIEEVNESPPQSIYPDNSVAFCTSLSQSKEFLHKNFGISTSQLRSINIPGIVVLSIKDYNLIRKDHRNHRIFPHLLVCSTGPDFSIIHTDFAQAIELLNK